MFLATPGLVEKILDIIQYFQPTHFIIKNPQTGRLKEQEFMKGIPYCDTTYCMYGTKYMKKTRIWNDANLDLKFCDGTCGSFANGKHTICVAKEVSGNIRRSMLPKKLMEVVYKQCIVF